MKRRLPTMLLLVWGLCSPAADVESLIKQLGAGNFAEREAAGQALWETGLPALEAVREAAASDDPEIRTRASKLLRFLEAGIRPGWPEGLRESALHFEELSDAGRGELMNELTDQLGADAIPFLLSRLEGKTSGHARQGVEKLMEEPDAAERVIEALSPQPATEDGALLLSAALSKAGREDAELISLGLTALPEKSKKKLLNEAVEKLIAMYRKKEFQKLYDYAGACAERVPDSARLLYLKGAGAARLDRKEEASACVREARALHPDDEAPHYRAALMLEELGQDSLAAEEWVRILKIPPEGEVYDINAYLHLGQINRRKGDFTRAANAYENALKFYRKARERGEGVAMVGADEEKLTAIIRELRERARSVSLGENPLQGKMRVVVKGGQAEKLPALAKTTAVQMNFSVQPYGLRLLEDAPASLIYDREEKEIQLTLNGKPVKGVPFEAKEERFRVLLRMLDMLYIFELDTVDGGGEMLERFELDYRFSVVPNGIVRQLRDPELIFNGNPVTWEELAEGIPLDFLPEKIEFTLKAKNDEGTEIKAEMNFDPRENAPDVP